MKCIGRLPIHARLCSVLVFSLSVSPAGWASRSHSALGFLVAARPNGHLVRSIPLRDY